MPDVFHPVYGTVYIADDIIGAMATIKLLQRRRQRLLLSGADPDRDAELHSIRDKLNELEPLRRKYIQTRFFS